MMSPMGIAWFDADPPPMPEVTLRTGGLPLLGEQQNWPVCAVCDLPMLFRAQIPLALTSLAAPSDNRLLLVFECHAQLEGRCCREATLVVSETPGPPRSPPGCDRFDLILTAWGEQPAALARVIESLVTAGPVPDLGRPVPFPLLRGMTGRDAQAASSLLRQRGAGIDLRPSALLTLSSARGGHLVPFDDEVPHARRTTLPPLRVLRDEVGASVMRGLIGGSTPGYRDQGTICAECTAPHRTALRLFADQTHSLGVGLGISTVQFCVGCGLGTLDRHG